MKTSIVAALALFLLPLCGIAAEAPASDDQEKIQGTWIVEVSSEDGEVQKEGPDQMVFAGDRLTMSDKQGKEKKGTFKLDPTKSPKVLIFPADVAPNVIPANFAYELKGDVLKIVNSAPRRKPTEISDKGQLLYVLKRKQP